MKIFFLSTLIVFMLIAGAAPQETRLEGEYRHEIRDEFYSVFNFQQDSFTLVEAGDLGVFFGKGKYQLQSNTLILFFDTLDIDRSKFQGCSIIEPKVDSLIANAITKRKLEIVHTGDNGKKFIQHYVKKRRSSK